MKRLLAAAAILAVATQAEANPPAPKGKGGEDMQYVAISPVAIPVINAGKVVNYVFVTVRIDLTPSANAAKLREKEPYFRDALVRAAHRTPFTLPTDFTTIDAVKLKAAVFRDAQTIAGPGAVRGVQIVSMQAKSLRV